MKITWLLFQGRSVTEMEQGTVAQNVAISLPEMKDNGTTRNRETAVKVTTSTM